MTNQAPYTKTQYFSAVAMANTTEDERTAAAKVSLLLSLPSGVQPIMNTLTHLTSDNVLSKDWPHAIRSSIQVE